MLLSEPAESPYDLRFALFGFPVRVAWTFWLAALIFGFSLVDGTETFLLLQYGSSPHRLLLLLLWCMCMLVSILIHELGHAFAFRQNGIHSSIVLYHFGGLAIPTASFSPGRSIGGLSSTQQIWVSFAGPLAQFASAAVLVALVKAIGYRVTVLTWMPGPFDQIPGVLEGEEIDSPGLFAIVTFYMFPSVLWALLNLVPVWPLDGGQIARSIVYLRGGNMSQSLWISVIAAGLMAAYGFSRGQFYLGILFLMLGVSSFQMLQQSGGWRN